MSQGAKFYDEYNNPPNRATSPYPVEDPFDLTGPPTPSHGQLKRKSLVMATNGGQPKGHAPSSLSERKNSEVDMQPVPQGDVPFALQRKATTTHATVAELQQLLNDAFVQIDTFVAERAAIHSNDPYRVGDDRIGRERDVLRSEIRQWSRNFMRSAKRAGLKEVVFGPVERNPFEQVTLEYPSYLSEKNPRGTALLVQGYVWMQLMTFVFKDNQYTWVGGPCAFRKEGQVCELLQSFKQLDIITFNSNKTAAKKRNYHLWRAQTARLLADSLQIHKNCVENRILQITDGIKANIKGFTDQRGIFGTKPQNTVSSNNLASIVRRAVALDLLFWQQKAHFCFEPEYSPQAELRAFEPVWMETDDPEANEELLTRKRAPVTLFCAPALSKFGTSEGDGYDKFATICHAVVDCLLPAGTRNGGR